MMGHMVRVGDIVQVTVGFSTHVRALGAAGQVDQLRKLGSAVDKVKHIPLQGVHIMLGHEYGVDSQGHLWLNVEDTALFWSG